MKISLRCAALIIIVSLFGCAGAGQLSKESAVYCPHCKVRVTGHRSLHGASRNWPEQIRYICPSCGKEWSGAAGSKVDAPVCPKCGRAVKECPECATKHAK